MDKKIFLENRELLYDAILAMPVRLGPIREKSLRAVCVASVLD